MKVSRILSLLLLVLLATSCFGPQESSSAAEGVMPSPTVASRDSAPSTLTPTAGVGRGAASEGRCGDGVCDGPENANNCPEDCVQESPTSVPSGHGASVCQDPNPVRAVVSQDLLEWRDWLDDGGFEEGRTEVVVSDHPAGGLKLAATERSAVAARTGSFGYVIDAGASEGVTFSIKFYIEKGEDIRFSFWARSLKGDVSLQPRIQWVEMQTKVDAPSESYVPDTTFSIGADWTKVEFVTDNTATYRYGLLSLEVGPNAALYLDDVRVEFPNWRMAEYTGASRLVGGVPVPPEPLAPLYMTVLIHIEDPPQLQLDERYFQQQTAIMRELARVLHEHGGMLTIQPEEDWAMGAEVFHPGLLRELVEEYGVVFSTHTHGPHCRDDEGRLRSYSDCQMNRDTAGWDQTPNDYGSPWVEEYVARERALLSEATGTQVTDHNGNWEYDRVSLLADAGVRTWSAYKNWRTQRTYDLLISNPWRPTQCSADAEIEKFVTHDPSTEIVYVPGYGQTITRHQERLSERVAPMISQFIRYVDPDRVNTFYVLTHVGTWHAREEGEEEAYIAYEPAAGQLVYSDEFVQDLRYWDEFLTEVIDPLVGEGYVKWASLPEMGQLFLEWEASCSP